MDKYTGWHDGQITGVGQSVDQEPKKEAAVSASLLS
jgi:hypothetical protein